MSLVLKNSGRSNISSDREEVWGFTYYAQKRSASFLYSNQQIAGAGQHIVRWDLDHSSPFQNSYLGKISWVEQERWTFGTRDYCQQYSFLPKQISHIDSQKRAIIPGMFLTCSCLQILQIQMILTGDTIAAVYVGKTCVFLFLTEKSKEYVAHQQGRTLMHYPVVSFPSISQVFT